MKNYIDCQKIKNSGIRIRPNYVILMKITQNAFSLSVSINLANGAIFKNFSFNRKDKKLISRSRENALDRQSDFKRRTMKNIALAMHTIEMIPKSMILKIEIFIRIINRNTIQFTSSS